MYTGCPVCGRRMCDHTPAERGQTQAEIDRPLSAEEEEFYQTHHTDDERIPFAQRHAHDPVPAAANSSGD